MKPTNKMKSYENKNRKIIQILCHSLENDETRDYQVSRNWCARLARSILNFTNKYRCEVWYAINNLEKLIEFEKENIRFKLFPAKTLHKAIESFNPIVHCPLLLKHLKNEDSKNTIIHFQGERGTLLHKVLADFPQYKITIQYHGYGQPSWLEWLEKIFLTPLERTNFKNVSHFFVHIKPRIDYLIKEIHIPKNKISYQNVGIDFNLFKPREKNWARNKLKLPLQSFIIIYVGALLSTKGVDKIIKAYTILKNKYPQLFFLIVGADKTDPLYRVSQEVADLIIDKIPNDQLPFYYNASDVYCFYGDGKTSKYAGIGTAPTEALASNLNVISTNLVHLPDKIKNKVGFIVKNFPDFVAKIEFLLKNPDFQFNARNLVEKYTSFRSQTSHLLQIYDQLFAKNNKLS